MFCTVYQLLFGLCGIGDIQVCQSTLDRHPSYTCSMQVDLGEDPGQGFENSILGPQKTFKSKCKSARETCKSAPRLSPPRDSRIRQAKPFVLQFRIWSNSFSSKGSWADAWSECRLMHAHARSSRRGGQPCDPFKRKYYRELDADSSSRTATGKREFFAIIQDNGLDAGTTASSRWLGELYTTAHSSDHAQPRNFLENIATSTQRNYHHTSSRTSIRFSKNPLL